MSILVTGGAGFIGSHVADELIKNGEEVIILDDLSGGFKDNVNDKAAFIQGSILDHVLIKHIFTKYKIEFVFHLAAYAAEGLSHFIRRYNYQNNLIGSINLINESVINNVKCFVFTSSIAVYGRNQLPMSEELTPMPEDPYGIAKYAIEQDIKAAHEMFGLDYIIFRPHNVYGERQNIGDKYRNVIGIFMNQIMKGQEMSIFGDGSQTRAFSYIKDVAPIIARSISIKEAYCKVFNVGADKPYSVNELVEVVCKSMGTGKNVKYFLARNEVQHAYSKHKKIKEIFNYSPQWSLEKGIAEMSKWALKVGSRESTKFDNIEIEKNLPLAWK